MKELFEPPFYLRIPFTNIAIGVGTPDKDVYIDSTRGFHLSLEVCEWSARRLWKFLYKVGVIK